MTDTAIATIGDNQPPENIDPLRARLQEDHSDLLARSTELLAAVDRVPETVTDDNAGKVGDFIKQLSAHTKDVEAVRVKEKEFFLAGGRNVDGFFNPIKEKLNGGKGAVESRLTVYQRAKAEEERKRREEEARKQREEQERLAAEAAKREQEAKDAATLEEAIAAEEAAKQAEADLVSAQREAEAKAADLSRTRGDYGSVASLRTFWDFEILSRDNIPLELLRPHIPADAIDKAIRSYIKAGGRDLGFGVRIFENTKTVVR